MGAGAVVAAVAAASQSTHRGYGRDRASVDYGLRYPPTQAPPMTCSCGLEYKPPLGQTYVFCSCGERYCYHWHYGWYNLRWVDDDLLLYGHLVIYKMAREKQVGK